jgi:signal transduction histidine kinase
MYTAQTPGKEKSLAALLVALDNQRDTLVSQYQRVLQDVFFTSRTEIRPKHLGRIALQEANTLRTCLTQPGEAALAHGESLCELGLTDVAVLRLGQATRQFLITLFANDEIAAILDIYDTYQNSVLQGYYQGRAKMVLNEQERIRGALHRAIDRYTVEIKEVEAMAERAAEASQFKSRFIAQTSHDLRTPLGAIVGLTEMLLEDVYGPLTDEQKSPLSRVLHNAQALSQALIELLDQARLEAGELKLRQAPFSPHEMARSVHLDCLPLALRKGLALSLRIAPTLPPTLIGDETRIGQILSNLVVNAIKYTDTGWINVSITHDDQYWALTVKDTGIGISPEALPTIFMPYRQVDEDKSRKVGGVGLGLAIVHQLVTVMGGTITVESRVGQGSTFKAILPLRMAVS